MDILEHDDGIVGEKRLAFLGHAEELEVASSVEEFVDLHILGNGLESFGEPVVASGGVAEEDIHVHRVPLDRIAEQVAAWRAQGYAMDVKLLLLLGAGMMA